MKIDLNKILKTASKDKIGIFVVNKDNNLVAKVERILPNGTVLLCPYNPGYTPIKVTREELEEDYR